jgi:hypothetical protein
MFNKNISESSALSKKVLRWCWAGFFSIVFQSSYAVTIDPDAEFYSGGGLQGVDTSNLPNMKVPDQRESKMNMLTANGVYVSENRADQGFVAVNGGYYIGYNNTDNTIFINAFHGGSGGEDDGASKSCSGWLGCDNAGGYTGCRIVAFVTWDNVTERDFNANNYEFHHQRDRVGRHFVTYDPDNPSPGSGNCNFSFVVPGHKAYMIKTLESWNTSSMNEDKHQNFYGSGSAGCQAWRRNESSVTINGETVPSGCIIPGHSRFGSYIRIYASRIY